MIIKLAWRNIWRNWRRSAITIFAVAFATILIISVVSLQEGVLEENIRRSLEIYSGFIQIQKEDYVENPELNKCFKFSGKMKNILEKNKKIKGFAPRIISQGLIGFGENSYGMNVIGIDPVREQKVSWLASRIKTGRFLTQDGTKDIVVGYKAMQNLKAHVGDTVVLLTAALDGSMCGVKLRVIGSINIGNPLIDNNSIIMNIKTADDLLGMNGKVSLIAISLSELDDIPIVKNELKPFIPEKSILVLDWGEFMPDFKNMMDFGKVKNLPTEFLLVVIVAFGILNTVLMSITERYREFGVMLAIGIKNFKLATVVFIELIFILFIGLVLGNVASFIITLYIKLHPIMLSGNFAELYKDFGIEPKFVTVLSPVIFIVASSIIFLISLTAFIYPGYKLLKLEALKGIRYT